MLKAHVSFANAITADVASPIAQYQTVGFSLGLSLQLQQQCPHPRLPQQGLQAPSMLTTFLMILSILL